MDFILEIVFNKKFWKIVGPLILVVFGFWAVQRVSRAGEVGVEIYVIPTDAKILINDKGVRGNPIFLKEGAYEAKFQREGFDDVTTQISVPIDQQPLVVLMNPNSEVGEKYKTDHPDEYLQAERFAGLAAQEHGIELEARNPIIKQLPYRTSYYALDYGFDEDNQPVIIVTAGDTLSRQVAIEKIKGWGFELSDYRMVFQGEKNPFGGQQ